jgi:hypothetical protein
MPGKVFTDEAGNEMITVIVALLYAQRERKIARPAGGFQVLGVELIGEEFIRASLINQ